MYAKFANSDCQPHDVLLQMTVITLSVYSTTGHLL